jgi:acyl carrier protein
MDFNDFVDKLSDTFEKDAADIHAADAFKEYDEWDSLTLLSLMATLEEEYGMTIPRVDFDKIESVQELFDYVKARQ